MGARVGRRIRGIVRTTVPLNSIELALRFHRVLNLPTGPEEIQAAGGIRSELALSTEPGLCDHAGIVGEFAFVFQAVTRDDRRPRAPNLPLHVIHQVTAMTECNVCQLVCEHSRRIILPMRFRLRRNVLRPIYETLEHRHVAARHREGIDSFVADDLKRNREVGVRGGVL